MIVWIARVFFGLLIVLTAWSFLSRLPAVTLYDTLSFLAALSFLGLILALTYFTRSKITAGLAAGVVLLFYAGLSLDRGYVVWPVRRGPDIQIERAVRPYLFWSGISGCLLAGMGSFGYAWYWFRRHGHGAQPSHAADGSASLRSAGRG